MAHLDYLKSICPLKGKCVVDVGAGDGIYSRQLDQAGAIVTAIEVDSEKVSIAREQLPSGIVVELGAAEKLPLSNQTQDLACFFFSFHHVPVEVQSDALAEIGRVLRPGGRLHVVEPFPYGTMFDVVRMVEDETFVRINSHRVLGGLAGNGGFHLLTKKEYTLTRELQSFDVFVEKIVTPNPDRRVSFEAVTEKMRKTYDNAIEEADGIRVLHQPCAAYHFEFTG